MTYEQDISAQNTVIVLDASASMQAMEGSQTRFQKAVAKARSFVGSKNTVILAKEVPSIGVRDASSNEAIKYLLSLTPTESSSRIGDAVILAGEALKGKGRVFVLSDFINTAGQDPNVAKSVLESKGLVVDFINVAEKQASNLGIIDLDADREISIAYIRNYDPVQRTATLKVGGTTKQLSIPAKSTDTFSFKTPPGMTKLELLTDDDFRADNLAYLSAPSGGKIKVALVTNNASIFLKNALEASGDAEVTIVQPPVIPTTGYDIYLIHNLDHRQLLPGTFKDLHNSVENGASVIIHAQDNSGSIDYQELLPMTLGAQSGAGFISVDQLNKFTTNIEFGSVTSYFTTSRQDPGFSTMASLGNYTMLALGKAGAGKLVYLGILESQSEFKFSPSYPIFWTELIRYLTGQLELSSLNFDTKDTLFLDEETWIKTPVEKLNQNVILLEHAGIYELPDRKLAVNLIDATESDINMQETIGAKSTEFELKPVKETKERNLDLFLLIATCILFIFEIGYIKFRGDV
jgi:hypothetical protein